MTFDDETVTAAFEQHRLRYAQKQKGAWDIAYHVEMWQRARAAFDGPGCMKSFQGLHDELHSRWQISRRGKGNHQSQWTAQEIYSKLRKGTAAFASKRLSSLSIVDADCLWPLLQGLEGLKVNSSSGPSIMAVSKFLHFWNPRLFVIVDRGVIWNHVFGHWWLWDSFKVARKTTDTYLAEQKLFEAPQKRSDEVCDLSSYLAVLVWASQLLKANPKISRNFEEYVQRHAGGVPLPTDIEQYEAVAIEWFLLGLVEIPPPGVHVNTRDSIWTA